MNVSDIILNEVEKMKKLLLVLCLAITTSAVYADHIYDYKVTQPINDINSIKMKGCNEYVQVESNSTFNAVDAANPRRSIRRTVAGTSIAGAIGGAILAMAMDPYVIEIDGNKYVLVVDRKDKNWSEKDLLGINDPKQNRFQSLIALNKDMDHSKISVAELKQANIRFVRLDKKGALLVNDRTKDYDLNKIDYIDIINLKRTANAEVTGIFGHFTVYLKSTNPKKRTAVGYVTYETNEKIQYLFK